MREESSEPEDCAITQVKSIAKSIINLLHSAEALDIWHSPAYKNTYLRASPDDLFNEYLSQFAYTNMTQRLNYTCSLLGICSVLFAGRLSCNEHPSSNHPYLLMYWLHISPLIISSSQAFLITFLTAKRKLKTKIKVDLLQQSAIVQT